MFIADGFTYVHMPKTGGTFVNCVLMKLHERRQPGALGQFVRRMRGQFPLGFHSSLRAHDAVYQIPRQFADKPILGTVRNPYDRYVSQYEFGFYKRDPYSCGNPETLRRRWPEFPDFNFERFVYFANEELLPLQNRNFADDDALGWHTCQFAQFFFRDPILEYPRIDQNWLEQKEYRLQTANIHFVNMDHLNQGIYDYLLSHHYPQKDIEFILHEDKILPAHSTRRADQDWESYYTPKLRDYVRKRERMIFEMFPEFDV